MKRTGVFIVFIMLFYVSRAQQTYIPDESPLINQRTREWQNLKFGLFMHWGTYSQWGIIASWSLNPSDAKTRTGEYANNYYEYKKAYENLQKTFNPTGFEPENWAVAAKNAGMRYVIFTTKHHDGFCMFDTKETNYKITDPSCPFSQNENADVTRVIFEKFRAKGFWTGAYFSKGDWNTDYYWWRRFPPCAANVNYDIKKYPEQWNKFVDFTHNQVMEIMTNYGVDILWFDGGWASSDGDIRMDSLVQKPRNVNPDVLVVDRFVTGKNQNYLTPENHVPKEPIADPWEVCLCSADDGTWSWRPGARYMSGREGVHLLIDVVSKGGNLLLNIAPGPDGKWDQGAYDMLEEYADWMKVNSEGIYNTRAVIPYREGKICFTRNEDSGNMFFFYLSDEGENEMPSEIIVKSYQPESGDKVILLGYKGTLKWDKYDSGFRVTIPENLRKNPPCKYAWTIKLIKAK